jgi:hypothetical protein
MRKMIIASVVVLIMTLLPTNLFSSTKATLFADGNLNLSDNNELAEVLSPVWGIRIRQWSELIEREAKASGLDPDFIAAVMNAESNGDQDVVSRVGAVGLMGVMPAGPGLEWRPSPESLKDPDINMSWGVAILTAIIRQSGGDIGAALAAYSGGWDQASSRVPMAYASRVLNEYGRAVAARSNISPDIASQWTVATEIKRGHIPVERLILSDEPISGLRTYGEHVVYHYSDDNSRALFVKGFAVPLAVIVPLDDTADYSGTVDRQLLARLGMSDYKISDSNPEVIKACLPSLSRLRGRLATRWFAPSACPAWHR